MSQTDLGEGAQGEGRCARGVRAGLGWAGLGHIRDRNPRHARPLNEIPLRTEIQNRTRRTHDNRQRNALRHDATPMTFRFWFIHDTDTCNYTGLKLGRRSETGREKGVTPEFGERKEEKILPPNSGCYTSYGPSRFPVGAHAQTLADCARAPSRRRSQRVGPTHQAAPSPVHLLQPFLPTQLVYVASSLLFLSSHARTPIHGRALPRLRPSHACAEVSDS
jgi:hypothetical protein